MPRGGAHFDNRELEQVLSHYRLGTIRHNEPLSAGNQRSPKRVLMTDRGRFILKRRPPGKDDLYHVAFAHAIQHHLASKGMPVAGLISLPDKSSALSLEGHTYEVFEFVNGSRCDGSVEAILDAGRTLARFHQTLSDFVCNWTLLRRTCHDSQTVRGYIHSIRGSEWDPTTSAPDVAPTIAQQLMLYYNRSSVTINQLGYDRWPVQIVHSDWHSGNLLFENRRVSCILDFDSVKLAPAVTDVANGALQFSIVADRPNPKDWPAYLDQAKMGYFLEGYEQVVSLPGEMLRAIPDLMIELLIAEAVHPVATTGHFGPLPGTDFLEMILRKCEWIDDNRPSLIEVVLHGKESHGS
jgi:Ser/Thr protein kinase RdoA (MazF antagonist)